MFSLFTFRYLGSHFGGTDVCEKCQLKRRSNLWGVVILCNHLTPNTTVTEKLHQFTVWARKKSALVSHLHPIWSISLTVGASRIQCDLNYNMKDITFWTSPFWAFHRRSVVLVILWRMSEVQWQETMRTELNMLTVKSCEISLLPVRLCKCGSCS